MKLSAAFIHWYIFDTMPIYNCNIKVINMDDDFDMYLMGGEL